MTNATDKTQITADAPDSGSLKFRFELKSQIAINASQLEIFTPQVYTMTVEADGTDDGAFYLPTPDATGALAWSWEVSTPNGASKWISIAWSATAQKLGELLTAAASSTTPSDLTGVYMPLAGGAYTGATDYDGNEATNLIDRQKVSVGTITGAAFSVDPQAANLFILEIQSNTTLTVSVTDAADGDSCSMRLTQDGTGSRLVTWANVNWSDNTPPTLETSANDYNWFVFIYNAAEGFWDGFNSGGFASLL